MIDWDFIVLTLGPWLLVTALVAIASFTVGRLTRSKPPVVPFMPPVQIVEPVWRIRELERENAAQDARITQITEWYQIMTEMWQEAERLRAKWHRLYKLKSKLLKGFQKP